MNELWVIIQKISEGNPMTFGPFTLEEVGNILKEKGYLAIGQRFELLASRSFEKRCEQGLVRVTYYPFDPIATNMI